jgi:hypothetical protein
MSKRAASAKKGNKTPRGPTVTVAFKEPRSFGNAQSKARGKKHKGAAARALNQGTDLRPTRGQKGKLSDIASYASGYRPHVTSIPMRCEQLMDVSGSVLFSNSVQVPINPGLASSFPWLSQLASAYEFYRFKHLSFEFRTTCGEVVSGTNPALGKVIMATDYDVLDSQFATKQQMENYEGNANGPPFQKIIRHVVNVEGRRMGQVLPYRERYVRSGAVPSSSPQGGAGDPHAYDIGLFQFGTAGMPAANLIGELWVCYSVDLIKPKTQTPSGQNLLQAHFAGATPTTANNLATAVVRSGTTLLLALGANAIVFPVVGAFAVQLIIDATSATAASVSYGAGCVGLSTLVLSGASQFSIGGNGGMLMNFQVNVTTPGAIVTINTPSTIVGGASVDLTAFQYSPGLFLDSASLAKGVESRALEERLAIFEEFMSRSICQDPRATSSLMQHHSQVLGVRDDQGKAALQGTCHSACSVPPRILDEAKYAVEDIEDLHLSETLMRIAKRRGFKDLPPSGLSSPGVIVQYEPASAPSASAPPK